MTPAAVGVLEEVAADLAVSEGAEAFARRWRAPSPPLREIAVRPWNADVAGGADVIFAEGAGPTIAQLAERFGELVEAPPDAQ